METVSMKSLETAMIYVRRMAEGKNPVNNRLAEDDSILNNPNVTRCMLFIEDILKQVYKNKGVIDEPKPYRKRSSELPPEVYTKFAYREDKSINMIISQIYEPVTDQNFRKISGKTVNDWMENAGYLCSQDDGNGKTMRVTTEKGRELGMYEQTGTDSRSGRSYIKIMYNRQAQEFLIKNMNRILTGAPDDPSSLYC